MGPGLGLAHLWQLRFRPQPFGTLHDGQLCQRGVSRSVTPRCPGHGAARRNWDLKEPAAAMAHELWPDINCQLDPARFRSYGSFSERRSRIPKCPDADEGHSTTHSCKSGYLAGLCTSAERSTEVIHRRSACNFLRSVAKMPCAALPAHAAAILFAARCAHAQQRSALPMVQLAGQLWGSSDGDAKIPADTEPHWPCTALLAQK